MGRGAVDNDGGVAGRPGDGGDAMHWKAWRRDGLDAVERTLGIGKHAKLCHALAFSLGGGGQGGGVSLCVDSFRCVIPR